MSAPTPALSDMEIASFIERGYLRVEGCLDPALVRAWAADVPRRLQTGRSGESQTGVLLPSTEAVPIAVAAPRLYAAVCALIGGESRLKGPGEAITVSNAFVVQPPATDFTRRPDNVGWHLDGPSFTRYLDSVEVGLLVFTLWSDVSEDGGATEIALGSPARIARLLRDHPEGLPWRCDALIAEERRVGARADEIARLHGRAGDAYLVHPLMVHRESTNESPRARLMLARVIELREKPRFGGDAGASPVERATLRGLGVTRLSFRRRSI